MLVSPFHILGHYDTIAKKKENRVNYNTPSQGHMTYITVRDSCERSAVLSHNWKMARILKAYDVIKQKTGITYELKAEQKQIIELLTQKQNVFAALPTGYGKSAIYALTPSLLDHVRTPWT